MLAAALAVCAFGAASAPALTLHACEENAAGATAQEYTSSTCETKGVGKYRTIPVAAGTPTTAKSIGAPVISGKILGVEVEIECSAATGVGKSENITIGMAKFALVKGLKIDYLECVVKKPKGEGCEVKGGGFESTELRVRSFLEEKTIRAELFGENSAVIAFIELEGCKDFELNSFWGLRGNIRGFTSTDPSLIEFPEASGTEVEMNGNPATYTGNIRLFMEGTTKRLAFATP